MGDRAMKTWFILPLVLASVIPSAGETLQEKNKTLVRTFYEMAFNQHRPAEAARLYIGERYIQHHPGVPDGAAAFYNYAENYFRAHPDSRVSIHHVIAEGDLVALHLHSQQDARDRGRAIVDIFRLENGKIVEHWDVIQDVPETSAGANTMF
jgi:predicted SnoaL-like aldol condensation-catalyzing enzyme